jgi:glycine/D-amino acid oxidase-like deaminating enzyme
MQVGCHGRVIGHSIAHHLAAHPRFAGSVTVVERDPTYARVASSLYPPPVSPVTASSTRRASGAGWRN